MRAVRKAIRARLRGERQVRGEGEHEREGGVSETDTRVVLRSAFARGAP
jgi:hypothetical protein